MNDISSRTPEGLPNRCTVCGKEVFVDPSEPFLDAPCPMCGNLLVWTPEGLLDWFRERFAGKLGIPPEEITLETSLYGLMEHDSLRTVEFVMQLEEELEFNLADEAATTIRTVRDLLQQIIESRSRRRFDDEPNGA